MCTYMYMYVLFIKFIIICTVPGTSLLVLHVPVQYPYTCTVVVLGTRYPTGNTGYVIPVYMYHVCATYSIRVHIITYSCTCMCMYNI